jgi:diaminopimelate decarboxylase
MAVARPVSDPDREPSAAALIAARPFLSVHPTDGLLMEAVPLARIADAVGSPTWVYAAGALRGRSRELLGALRAADLDAQVHSEVMANDHLAILSLLAAEGLGADVVSEGELCRALQAGIAPSRIVFSGVGKTTGELRAALAADIAQVNVESAEELEMLSALARTVGRTARVALRVNPDVDAGTHEKISTGRARDKFGIAYDDAVALYRHAARLPGIAAVGLAAHIGSQIETLAPYHAAFGRLATLVHTLRAAGERVETLDCGGGLGIGYRNQIVPGPDDLAAAIRGAFHNLDVRLHLEPGRWLVGPPGLLLASVVLTKMVPGGQSPGARFVVLDAGMNDLMRPAMYDAWHGIVAVGAADLGAPRAPARSLIHK